MFCAAAAPFSPLPRKLFLDVLAPARERHHLLAAVTFEFPAAVGACDVDPIAEVFDLARKLGSIDRAGEGLGAIDLYWIEATPCSVGSPSHVRDDDVSMEMRIGTIAVFCAFGDGRAATWSKRAATMFSVTTHSLPPCCRESA